MMIYDVWIIIIVDKCRSCMFTFGVELILLTCQLSILSYFRVDCRLMIQHNKQQAFISYSLTPFSVLCTQFFELHISNNIVNMPWKIFMLIFLSHAMYFLIRFFEPACYDKWFFFSFRQKPSISVSLCFSSKRLLSTGFSFTRNIQIQMPSNVYSLYISLQLTRLWKTQNDWRF